MLTFTLIALLLYPDGHYIPLHIGENLTGARCAVREGACPSSASEHFHRRPPPLPSSAWQKRGRMSGKGVMSEPLPPALKQRTRRLAR